MLHNIKNRVKMLFLLPSNPDFAKKNVLLPQ